MSQEQEEKQRILTMHVVSPPIRTSPLDNVIYRDLVGYLKIVDDGDDFKNIALSNLSLKQRKNKSKHNT